MSRPPQPSVAPGCASDERGYQRIRVRQDTSDNWLKNDPILASGEFGYVIGSSDPSRMLKIGDGWVKWSQLPWIGFTAGGDAHSCSHVVSEVEPPPGVEVGDLWIRPPAYTLHYWSGDAWEIIAAPGAIISAVEPPPPEVPGVLWVNTSSDGSGAFTDETPIAHADAPATQAGTEPLDGIVPVFVAAIPVIVQGKRYLMPLMEAEDGP